jgi:hypothetical protein
LCQLPAIDIDGDQLIKVMRENNSEGAGMPDDPAAHVSRTCVATVTLDALVLNGTTFVREQPLNAFIAVLGQPTRVIDPKPPAPLGHRNNQIHMYDDLGLYLTENHATRLIGQVAFVLWPEESPFRPLKAFHGELTVGDVRFWPGMPLKDCEGSVLFQRLVGGLYEAEGKVHLSIFSRGRKLWNRHRGKRHYVVDLCVGLSVERLRKLRERWDAEANRS